MQNSKIEYENFTRVWKRRIALAKNAYLNARYEWFSHNEAMMKISYLLLKPIPQETKEKDKELFDDYIKKYLDFCELEQQYINASMKWRYIYNEPKDTSN